MSARLEQAVLSAIHLLDKFAGDGIGYDDVGADDVMLELSEALGLDGDFEGEWGDYVGKELVTRLRT